MQQLLPTLHTKIGVGERLKREKDWLHGEGETEREKEIEREQRPEGERGCG